MKQFILVNISMTWAESLAYCRLHYHDLAMIENADENQAAMAVKGSSSVWLGLYREPFRWSDNNNSPFRNWLSGEPNNAIGNEHCAVQRSDLLWMDLPCDCLRPFVCEVRKERLFTIKLKLQSNADLSDPVINGQIIKELRAELRISGPNTKIKWNMAPTKQEEKPVKDACITTT